MLVLARSTPVTSGGAQTTGATARTRSSCLDHPLLPESAREGRAMVVMERGFGRSWDPALQPQKDGGAVLGSIRGGAGGLWWRREGGRSSVLREFSRAWPADMAAMVVSESSSSSEE